MEQAFLEWHDRTYGPEARDSLMLEERRMIFYAGWELALPYMYRALQEGMAMVGRGITAQTGKSAGIWSRLLRIGLPRTKKEG